MLCVWESQESWWDGFAFSPALPAKDIFPDCRWPAILVAHGAGAVPCQCCTAPWWWKQLSTSPSSSTGVRGCLSFKPWLQLPCLPAPFGTRMHRPPHCPGSIRKGGCQEKRDPGPRTGTATAALGAIAHPGEGAEQHHLCFASWTTVLVFHLWPSPTSLLCISCELWLKRPRPCWTQTETHWFQQFCWPEAACWLLPGATFPAFMTPMSLDAGVARRAAVK